MSFLYASSADRFATSALMLAALSDETLLEKQVIRYILQNYRRITAELWMKVVHEVKPHREGEMVSLAAEEWMRQGEARGKAMGQAEGIAKGIAEGKAEGLLIALEARFGPVPPEVEARVRRSGTEQLDGMFRRLALAPTIQDILADDLH